MEKRKLQVLLEVFKALLGFMACYTKRKATKPQVLNERAW